METSAIDPDRRQAALPLPVAQTRPVGELGDAAMDLVPEIQGIWGSSKLGWYTAPIYIIYIYIIDIYI
jgi:hypothetical protein